MENNKLIIQRQKWNKTRYEKHNVYHKIYYLENKYSYIFEEHKDELKLWLENNNMTPTLDFIVYIRTFIRNPKLNGAHYIRKLFDVV